MDKFVSIYVKKNEKEKNCRFRIINFGNNYFKLRDIAQVFDFEVTWDGSTNTVGISTSSSYVE